MPIHRRINGNSVHVPYFRIYADDTARLADSGFTVDQLNKKALQESDYSEWLLIDYSPITWQSVTVPVTAISKVLKSVRYNLVFDSSSGFNIGTTVPDNSRIVFAIANVTTAFNGITESTITVGDAGDADRLILSTDIDLHSIGSYYVNAYYDYVSSTQVTGTYVRDSASVGAANIEIIFSIN